MGIELRRGIISEDWIIENADAVFRWTQDQDKRDRDTDQRHRDLMRVHAEGWKGVAAAIERGLGSIADAIRSR
ncbi:hypothetical protein Drose_06015 [Dactylosporangium roseum]|uniref:Uncharacterized protein n=1 Tax=Dactylosporangium roseum TaxID=47989 RepID=A0ABY5ZAJ2_9ACTN|nr:hypothetical protein [Dactylosporangium roseum]UWZ37827.1 hypothetical protein Drose_06015 [Dactylosporangium roseum]